MPNSTLHLTNAYHAHSGGIRTMYHALLRHAEAEGRRMTLVVPGPYDDVDVRGRFTRVVYIRAPRSPVVDRRYRLLLPHRFLRRGRGPLWRLLEQERPAVVEVCDKYSLCFFAGLIRRRMAERPTLVGLSCERMDDNVAAFAAPPGVARTTARSYLGRVYLGMFDAHIANSAYTADELRGAMRSPHLRPVHECAMGVERMPVADPARAAALRAMLRAHATLGAPPQVVAYAGRLSPEKQVMLLPEVMAALTARARPVHMIVAGDGPLRQSLVERARALAPGRVHLVGHLAHRSEVAALLGLADVFLHPNGREPFGIGPLEAMAMGTPVVAPASGGLLTYANLDNAWLSAPHAAALAHAVSACLDDEDARRRRIAAGRLTAASHTWPRAAARMFERYDQIHAERVAARTAAPSKIESGEIPVEWDAEAG